MHKDSGETMAASTQLHVLDPNGNHTREVIIGEGISAADYERFVHDDGHLYGIVAYTEGRKEMTLVPKHQKAAWESTRRAFAQMDEDTNRQTEQIRREIDAISVHRKSGCSVALLVLALAVLSCLASC